MHITIANDSSVSGAPSGFQGAVNAAVAFYDRTITNNINLTIHFGYGEVNGSAISTGAAAQSESNGYDLTYAQLLVGLDSAATSQNDLIAIANLPGSDPTTGSGSDFYVAYAQTVALGFNLPSADAFVGLSSADPFNYDPNHRAVSGEFDAIGALEHEISENLGRIEELGSPSFTLLDLYRYASAGVRDLTGGDASFSIDGTHLLQQFNNPQNTGDAGDWIPSLQGDSFGDNYQGEASLVSRVDLEVMDALGYTIKWWFADDFSNTGFSDILWRNSSNGELDVWNATNLNPNSNFTFSPQELGVVPAAGWTLETVGDYNGDGKVDLLWRNNSNGEVDVWNSTGSSTVGFTTGTLSVVPTVWALQQSAADFNGDGFADLVWRNTSTGELDLWSSKNNGSESYNTQNLGVIPLVWSVQEFGDFNGDGRADIIWRNSSTNEVDVWSSKVGTGVAFNTQDLGVVPTVWAMQGIGDFNGNGNDGLVWRNTSNGEVDIWSFTGKTSLSLSTQEIAVVPTSWNLVAVGDYNGDGKADLLWQNASTGEVDAWLSNSGAGISFTFHELSVVPTSWHVETDWHSI
jgi:hypothetical protein